jgi:hypothetical protein
VGAIFTAPLAHMPFRQPKAAPAQRNITSWRSGFSGVLAILDVIARGLKLLEEEETRLANAPLLTLRCPSGLQNMGTL